MEVFDHENHKIEVKRRAFQRHLSLTVRPNGNIRVVAGKTTPKSLIFAFVKEQATWIEKVQSETQKLRDKHPKKQMRAGESFPYLGSSKTLRIIEDNRVRPKVQIEDLEIRIYGPKEITDDQIHTALIKQYKKQSQKFLMQRIYHYANHMKLHPNKLSFRSQKTMWGSCGPGGHISLNWRLVAAPLRVIDYVVVHELAHLKHPNHSKSFWKLVEEHSPDFKQHKKWLRDNAYSMDFLATKSELYG